MSFPVTESTLSANELGKFIQQQYGLSTVTTCKLFRTGMNHSYHVADGQTRFVLRIYNHQWRTKMEISEEVRLLRLLHGNGVNVSYPIADKNAVYIQELDAPEGMRYAVLFSFASGKKVSALTAAATYHIGRTMAGLHRVTENLVLNRTTYSAKTLLSDSFTRTASFFTAGSPEMDFVKSTTQYLLNEYNNINVNAVRSGVIHLDIWFDNMHLAGEDRITIFDFDFCGNGWLCHDIGYFMFQLYNTNQAETEYRVKVESFLKGYEEIIPLRDEERRIIPLTGLAIFLFYLGVQCITFDSWSNIFLSEDHLKRFTGTMKRWVDYNKIVI